jgi:hypothetical protein
MMGVAYLERQSGQIALANKHDIHCHFYIIRSGIIAV